MYRINNSAGGWVVDLDAIEQIGPTVQSVTPGRYLVEETRADDNPFPSGHQSRPWGTAIHHPDGRVVLRQFLYCDDAAAPLDRIQVQRSLRSDYRHGSLANYD
jgi:hypothetical protein